MRRLGAYLAGLSLLVLLMASLGSFAAAQTNPQSGNVGLQGRIPTDPPSTGATISFPRNGATITQVPVTVTGVCPKGLLVKLFKNEIFAGSAICTNGTFSIQIDLFSGTNELVARVYDALDQPGPDSNKVTVTYDDSTNTDYRRVFITTNFAKKGVDPGKKLQWPFAISGGLPPYAISVDWGDGTIDLISRAAGGEFTAEHVYKSAGQYRVIVKATDSAGNTTFMQVVAVANGPIKATDEKDKEDTKTKTVYRMPLWPLLVLGSLLPVAFWLGRRYALNRLRQEISKFGK